MDPDLEEPVQKKLRQDCPESSIAPSIDTWGLCSIVHQLFNCFYNCVSNHRIELNVSN
jgi:hypothetical protein